MRLLSCTKITAAIVGSVVLVAVVRWIAADVYSPNYPDKPAYNVPGVTESAVDLAALRRSWPQALDSEESRVRLMSYMRNMPHNVAGNAPAAPANAAASPATKAAPEPALDLMTRLARADVAKGERSVRKCAACHKIDQTGEAAVGPNLWGVVGRPVAKAAGFSYSDAMQANGAKTPNWTPEELDVFLTKPEARVPGTRMTFPGLPDQQERADVITYLNTKSDKPLPLPKGAG
jgi:cytochrome c